MLTSVDADCDAGNVMPAPLDAGVAFPTPIVVVALGVVNVGEVENTRFVLVVPVAPDAVYPVMLLNAVMLALDAFVPPFATGKTPVTPLVKSICDQAGLLLVPVFAKYLVAVVFLAKRASVLAADAYSKSPWVVRTDVADGCQAGAVPPAFTPN